MIHNQGKQFMRDILNFEKCYAIFCVRDSGLVIYFIEPEQLEMNALMIIVLVHPVP